MKVASEKNNGSKECKLENLTVEKISTVLDPQKDTIFTIERHYFNVK